MYDNYIFIFQSTINKRSQRKGFHVGLCGNFRAKQDLYLFHMHLYRYGDTYNAKGMESSGGIL